MTNKLRYYALWLFCLLASGLSAQTWTASAPAEGTFFLYNVGNAGFIYGANNWGTRASLTNETPLALTFTAGSDGGFYISTSPVYNGCYLGSDGYVDKPTSDQHYTTWLFTPVEGQEQVYTMKAGNSTGNYLYGHADDATKTSVGTTAPADEKSYWKLASREALIAAMANATADAPMDVTFLVQDAYFGKNTDYNTVWHGSVALGGPTENQCAERFNKSSFEIYQTITGIPNGIYKMTVSGFYRYGDMSPAAAAREASATGVEPLLGKYYINNTEAPLMSIFDCEVTHTNNSTYNTSSAVTVNGTNYYLPNNMDRAAACFGAGYYVNAPIQAVVTDGTVRIGLRKTEARTNDWAIFDNVKLYYCGIDLSAIKESALAQWDEYNAKTVENGDRTTYDATLAAIKSQIENATEEVTIGEALKGLKPAYQLYASSPEITGVPLDLTHMLVNANLKGGNTGWTTATTGGSFAFDTGVTPAVVEAYAGWDALALTAFSIQQTDAITLSPGKYRLKVHGFYRYGVSYNSDGDNPTSLAYMFAGDNRQELMRLGDLANNTYPNSISEASAAFGNGKYVNAMLFTLDEPTTLTVGVEGTHDLKQSWFIMGPVTLEKVMENDALGEYIVRWEALKTVTNQALDHNGFDATVENGTTATTEAEMQAADAAVWEAFCLLLKNGTTATGQFDLTSLIDGRVSTEVAQELYNQTDNKVEFALSNLPAGTYTVKVQSFHRSQGYQAASIAYENGTDQVAANLYLGNTAVAIRNINDDARYIPYRRDSDVPGAFQRSIPNTLNGATAAFNAGLYWNTLTATTSEDGDITFGLAIQDGKSANWMPYNNFRLYYGAAKRAVTLSVTEPYALAEDTRADVTTDIALHAGEYNKVCLPFDLTAGQVTEQFSGAYMLTGVTAADGTLTGTLVPATDMKAGHAYFVTVETDKTLAVNDVLLRSVAPDSIPVIWEGAATVGSYDGYTFAINMPADNEALASTLTLTPIDFANVNFTTNLENWQARRFVNDVTYDQSSASLIALYNQAPPSRRDQPHSVFIPVPAGSEPLTLTVSVDGEVLSTVNFPAGTTLCEVPNLLPQQTYTYQVEANGTVLTQGQFQTEGRLRMIKATSGSNIRDLGGWQTLDGNRIRYGLIYRGGELNAGHTMNAADIQVLRGLNIGGEVDFREDIDFSDQTLHNASALGDDVDYTYENLHLFNEDALQQKTDVFRDAFTLTLNTLRSGKSVFFHCIWGADRTGCYAMLLEGLLGLTEDQLCKDYELTSFSHAGIRNKNGLDSKFNYIKTMPGETLQEQFYNYWHVAVGITKEDLLEFITRMVDGESSILTAELPEYGVTALVPDGDYYLYVPDTEQFMGRGDNWGTRVMLDNYGVPAHIATSGFGVTTIQFLDSKLYFGSDVHTDKSASYNSINWTTEPSGEGFVLKSDVVNETGLNYLKLEDEGKLHLSAATAAEATVFVVKTLAEQQQLVAAKHLASANAALQAAGINIAATSWDDVQNALGAYTAQPSAAVIKSATAGNTEDWVLTQAGSQQDVWNVYNIGTYGGEIYQKCGSTISQTVSVPHPGLYKLTLNAFFRQAGNADCYPLGEAGYELSDAWVSINETYFTQIPSWYSECTGEATPNNTDEAKALMDQGKYAMEVIAYVGADKQLTISLHAPGYVAGCWCLFNNFALTEYVKEVQISEDDTQVAAATEAANVTLQRTLSPAYWNTFSVPFDLTAAQTSEAFGADCELYAFDTADASSISFKPVDAVTAGAPYLLRPAADVENPTFTGVSVTAAEGTVEGTAGSVQFVGQTYMKSLTDVENVCYLSTSGTLKKLSAEGNIKGLRAFFIVPQGIAEGGVKLFIGDTAVGLHELAPAPQTADIYTLTGVKVRDIRDRGIYLINGKKVINK